MADLEQEIRDLGKRIHNTAPKDYAKLEKEVEMIMQRADAASRIVLEFRRWLNRSFQMQLEAIKAVHDYRDDDATPQCTP